MYDFPEIAIGGILVAPFMGYAVAALVVVILLRPLLRWVNFDGAFANPPLANLCIYVIVLMLLLVLL